MLVLKLIVCLLIIYECSSFLQSCSDCMPLHECPDVALIPNDKKDDIFRKTLCGRTKVNGMETIMVCCSHLADKRKEIFELAIRYILDEWEKTINISIEDHPNIYLLPEICGKKLDDRIIGGSETDIFEFPWMALIYQKDEYGKLSLYCGGSIISSRYILTAAHCVYEKGEVSVRVGDFNIQNSHYCQGVYPHYECELRVQELRVQKTIPHEEYHKFRNMQINDIALLRVNEIDFSLKNVKPICLPVRKEIRNVNLSGKCATVAGWGFMKTGKMANILQKITIPILPENECDKFFERDSYPNESLNKTFCASEKGKDSCTGDSGGPLMILDTYNDDYRMIQYGIVSYGSMYCGNEAPGVYTDVTKYMDWILNNIE